MGVVEFYDRYYSYLVIYIYIYIPPLDCVSFGTWLLFSPLASAHCLYRASVYVPVHLWPCFEATTDTHNTIASHALHLPGLLQRLVWAPTSWHLSTSDLSNQYSPGSSVSRARGVLHCSWKQPPRFTLFNATTTFVIIPPHPIPPPHPTPPHPTTTQIARVACYIVLESNHNVSHSASMQLQRLELSRPPHPTPPHPNSSLIRVAQNQHELGIPLGTTNDPKLKKTETSKKIDVHVKSLFHCVLREK